MSKMVPSLKRDDAGHLPLDDAFEKMESAPQVTLTKVVGEACSKGSGKSKGDGKGPGQGAKRDATGGFKRPSELSDDSLHHNTSDSSRICWNYNLKKEVRMKCLQPRSLLACPAWKKRE